MIKRSRELFIGERFGVLTVTSKKYMPKDHTHSGHDCRCDCGKVKFVPPSNLLNGHTKSCGCRLRYYTEDEIISHGVKRVFSTYKCSAKKRGLEFSLTKEVLKGLILSPCHYCGELGTNKITQNKGEVFIYTGIDRVDNDLGYTPENTVSCCTVCNKGKLKMSEREFFSWIKRIYLRYKEQVETSVFINTQELGFRRVYSTYKHTAKKRGLPFLLSLAELSVLIKSPCYYCGELDSNTSKRRSSIFKYNGIDRMNNDLGYYLENVVPCCETCNRAKLTMSMEEFYSWVDLVYTKYHKET